MLAPAPVLFFWNILHGSPNYGVSSNFCHLPTWIWVVVAFYTVQRLEYTLTIVQWVYSNHCAVSNLYLEHPKTVVFGFCWGLNQYQKYKGLNSSDNRVLCKVISVQKLFYAISGGQDEQAWRPSISGRQDYVAGLKTLKMKNVLFGIYSWRRWLLRRIKELQQIEFGGTEGN